jgi:hypothetical protein
MTDEEPADEREEEGDGSGKELGALRRKGVLTWPRSIT